MFRQISLAISLGTLALAGCPTRDVSNLAPHMEKEQIKDIPVEVNRNIDILFVIDNSGSMSQEQASLATQFPRFIDVLESIEGGLPNVHIGVVSSNVGIGMYSTTGCSGAGDDGRLQNTARGACAPPSGYYISDVTLPDGNRQKNYTGTLADTFSCIARLGTTGCGLEHHFESMKRALDGHNPQNANFLRPEAYLAVIFLADEDDCSARDSTVFDPEQKEVTDPLGPFGSFRCAEFGVTCDGRPIARTPAEYASCEPRGDSYMWHPDHYVEFLKGLKPDPGMIIVGGIVGNAAPFRVVLDSMNTNPELGWSCKSSNGEAAPGVRFKYFLDQFPDRSTMTSICSDDLSDALTIIAQLLKRVIGNPCIDGAIDTTDIFPNEPGLQVACQVSDVRWPGTDDETSEVIERCPMADADTPNPSSYPCWWTQGSPAACPDTATGILLNVERNGADPPSGTHVIARCVAD